MAQLLIQRWRQAILSLIHLRMSGVMEGFQGSRLLAAAFDMSMPARGIVSQLPSAASKARLSGSQLHSSRPWLC